MDEELRWLLYGLRPPMACLHGIRARSA